LSFEKILNVDVMVLFIETARENWAFASGVQYYVDSECSYLMRKSNQLAVNGDDLKAY
jgi:hypothetical protein